MRTGTILRLIVVAVLAASCAPLATPPPNVTPTGEDRFLVDPRIGYVAPIPPALNTRFEAAWRFAIAGDEPEARRRLNEILQRDPGFAPAILAGAALDLRAGRFAQARDAVAALKQRIPDYTAAAVYEAEIAFRENRTRVAYDLYRALAARPDAPPVVAERLAELRETVFNELYAAAQTAPDAEAIRLLREALAIDAGAIEPRILLATKLIANRQFEEARRELDPLLNTSADRTDVQALLAEIDAGRGRYQEAIVRYERLARRTNDPRHAQRLEAIKQEWNAANMPSHYRAALESRELTRAQFATLLYWTVPAIRFAQNLGAPPIAVDIEDLAGREEIIRAIAIGLFDVDAVTRRVSPYRHVTAGRLSTHLARTLQLRGASCARGVTTDRILAACGVQDPLATHPPDALITGREAHALLSQLAGKL